MSKKGFFFIFSVVFCLFLFGCNQQNEIVYNQENTQFIEAVSPTGIGRLSKIAISFVYEPKCPMGEALSLYPEQKGTWEFDDRTAIFTPEKPYKANSKIILKADCGKLFGTGDSHDYFSHELWVTSPKYDINFDDIRYNDNLQSYTVSGTVVTDIPVEESEIASTLNAKLYKKAKVFQKKQSISWQKSDKAEVWNFSIDDIPSSDKKETLSIGWSAIKLGFTKVQNKLISGSKIIEIPSQAIFSILDVNTSKPNTILVSFSKTLDKTQNIASFIRSLDSKGKPYGEFNTSIRGNVLSIFSDNNFSDIQTLTFEPGIMSSDGAYLAMTESVQLSDNWELPSVRFVNDNVILPTTQGTVFPIETRNLTGVLVQVYAIYERNITQFLQTNELSDTSDLYRVGEPVWEKKVSFDWDDSMQNKYIRNGLDLSALAKKYPAGMFHIRITFRKDQIKYQCKKGHPNFSDLSMPPDTIEPYTRPNEKSSWDSWENANVKNRNSYWSYDNDPCHPAFYMPKYNSKCICSRNILISDLGIMAKRDNTGALYVTVADIKTAEPMAGVNIEIRNFIGSVISSGRTDSNGIYVFKDSEKAYIVTANNNNQTSYLRLAAGTNLSTSHFEIGGEKSENGVKGFIYGERGVWRPGDSLYLTFVLQDLQKTLPKNIPVKFELIDPLGRITLTKQLTESLNGFYPIEAKTDLNATTGLWIGRVTIGGKVWTKKLSIEAVVPNHLAVDLTSDGDYLSAAYNNFTIKSSWLHGAPTPNYKADVSVSFSQAETAFDGYSEYTFTNVSNKIEAKRETIWTGSLNTNSEVIFNSRLDAGRNLPGKLRANFITRVFEPSGGFSTQNKTMIYSPYRNYVGLKLPKGDATRNMLLTDVDHTVDVVFVDENGNPVSSNSLEYTVYKIDWKWWWEKDAYTSATYVSSRYYNKITSGTLSVPNGKGSFKFQVKYPDWGRYLVEVRDGANGHSASKIVYIDWPGWAGRAQEGGTGSSAMVPLIASKKQYSIGETAEISFTSNSEASAYVTIEKGGSIIRQQYIKTQKGTNVYKLPLTEEMSPNVYVHLTLLQPHMQTANSLPIRLYGVVPILVDNPKTLLKPVITTAESFEPNKNATVSVSESSGRAMTYTLAVVDEGLLGLTNFHSADLRNEFYKKEASELENWDIYRYVMNAYSGKLETILAIGGSEDSLANGKSDENRFAPVVKYFGPYHLAAGEKKATTFEMPYYVGAVRAMVIAGEDGAYGLAEKTVTVKAPIMVQASVPRTLGTNEKISIPVTLFNEEDYDKVIEVNFNISGALSYNIKKNIIVTANRSFTVNYPIETKGAGKIVVDVDVQYQNQSSKSTTEVEIESRGIPVTYKKSFTVRPGETITTFVTTPKEKGSGVLSMELSPFPQIDLTSRLSYLIQYPHGCIEQITSGGFPQLFVPSYVKLSPDELKKINDNVYSVFERYPTYQTNSGAMGYWPGNQEPHAWGTCYSTHFLLEAKKKGYDVPENILEAELKWLKDTAAEWTISSNDSTSIQAYRLFVLALAGKSDMSAMNRLQTYMLDNEAKLLLAAAFAYSGRQMMAQSICKEFKGSTTDYRSTGRDFSSNIRENAMYLFACIQSDYILPISDCAKKIAETLSSEKWLNTQETAWSLYALLPYYSEQKMIDSSYTIDCNGESVSGQIDFTSVVEKLSVADNDEMQTAKVTNTGKNVIYGTLICSGVSVAGTEAVQNEGLSMTVEGLEHLDSLSFGENIKITVLISNRAYKDLTNIALTLPIPTCLEFTNERLSDQKEKDSSYTYQDIRDDAIYTYFDLNKNAQVRYTFNATVAYKGSFYIPAIHAEAMYDSSIVTVNPGKFVELN